MLVQNGFQEYAYRPLCWLAQHCEMNVRDQGLHYNVCVLQHLIPEICEEWRQVRFEMPHRISANRLTCKILNIWSQLKSPPFWSIFNNAPYIFLTSLIGIVWSVIFQNSCVWRGQACRGRQRWQWRKRRVLMNALNLLHNEPMGQVSHSPAFCHLESLNRYPQ